MTTTTATETKTSLLRVAVVGLTHIHASFAVNALTESMAGPAGNDPEA